MARGDGFGRCNECCGGRGETLDGAHVARLDQRGVSWRGLAGRRQRRDRTPGRVGAHLDVCFAHDWRLAYLKARRIIRRVPRGTVPSV
jgi:hypothetical protein